MFLCRPSQHVPYNRTLALQSDPAVYKDKIAQLVQKYSYFNREYQSPYNVHENFNGRPQLLDAVLTNCDLPIQHHTHREFTDETQTDIENIVHFMPDSKESIMGYLKCRSEMTPLALACHNKSIPLSTIEFLVRQGCNANALVLLRGGRRVTIIESMTRGIDLNKYGLSETDRAESQATLDRASAIQAIFARFA